MKTEVIMYRDFNGKTIRQMSKSGYLCATDITDIYNEIRVAQGKAPKRMQDYFDNKETQEFLEALCNELNLLEESKHEDAHVWVSSDLKFVRRGKDNKGTWMHPQLFERYGEWLSRSPNPKYEQDIQ